MKREEGGESGKMGGDRIHRVSSLKPLSKQTYPQISTHAHIHAYTHTHTHTHTHDAGVGAAEVCKFRAADGKKAFVGGY